MYRSRTAATLPAGLHVPVTISAVPLAGVALTSLGLLRQTKPKNLAIPVTETYDQYRALPTTNQG